ncbi:DNA-(apurinic or apyrimidinic site) lyase [Ruminiclostridium papyrosolvens DSM 2782]|uniref:DNA-(apurinic or apyrimidinic site) lyase n=1 Tax=Ruminiclostridium papyrosolvens DSM 2782 TaxID=588581 RepID=F1TB88_9FIRM|nr:DNA glycosylase [Ruminiclostridium papyrosolvens]EGD48292.1 DNA-(apurinic or apyrimidinic site) lyase [Ruminiclostridium papyrosolvens DSM 2782]WES34202.1 DNA glycosylase [Ruminiclostridium papyrosolvens DSM 2782]
MEYKGYTLDASNGNIYVKNVKDFNLTHIFECGQCFRWIRQEDGSYKGIAGGRLVNVSYDNEILCITNSGEQDFKNIWYEYFDLGTDYSKIKASLEQDEIMKEAIKTGWGIRLLKQDFWEMLISFIISANNMIPRIMKTVDTLSALRGKCIDSQQEAYSFPDVETLAKMSLEEIQQCKAGFRCKYIHKTAALMAQGIITEDNLRGMDTALARKELMKLPGVGPKVADCILLFSGMKYDVFPTDVWVKRVMEELYLKKESGLKEIQQFASKQFGDLTGYAQQYLFYHARLNRIGMSK